MIARNSVCMAGHMGCVIVRGLSLEDGSEKRVEQVGEVLLTTTNSPLFKPKGSDCHAEANAVARAAAGGLALQGTTCFVTKAPCSECYKLLATAGIRKIVSRELMPKGSAHQRSAAIEGIDCVEVPKTEERSARLNALAKEHIDYDAVTLARKERKEFRKGKS